MNTAQLRQIMPNLSLAKVNQYLPLLEDAMTEFEINNLARQAAFVAQLAHESAELRYFEEIASGAAYEGRKGLGNTEKGDGKRFKGRGPIQITGRANYQKYGEMLGLDLILYPELASKPENGFRLAGAFWKVNGLNALADLENFKAITKRINGGYNGLADRQKYYKRALKVLADTPGLEPEPHDETPAEAREIAGDNAPEPVVEQPKDPPPKEINAQTATTVNASKPGILGQIGSISIPTGLTTALATLGTLFMGIPAWAWALIIVAGILAGAYLWNEKRRRAHERTLKIVDVAADPNSNNVYLGGGENK